MRVKEWLVKEKWLCQSKLPLVRLIKKLKMFKETPSFKFYYFNPLKFLYGNLIVKPIKWPKQKLRAIRFEYKWRNRHKKYMSEQTWIDKLLK